MLNDREGMPGFIDFGTASKHDRHFLGLIDIPEDSFLAMAKAYVNYKKFKQWRVHRLYFVTRLIGNSDNKPTNDYI